MSKIKALAALASVMCVFLMMIDHSALHSKINKSRRVRIHLFLILSGKVQLAHLFS